MKPFPALVILTATAVAVSACGNGGPQPVEVQGRGHARLVASLCTAAASARSGDRDRARRLFFDGAHQPIHELASATSEVDRVVSAQLLEAKQVVEGDLGDADAAGLADHLVALAVAAMVAAAVSDDGTRPTACRPS